MHHPTPGRAALLAVVAVAVAALSAFTTAHMRLAKSFPEKDEVLHRAPDHIQLWFSQAPEVAVTRVRLTGTEETRFTVGKAKATDDPTSVMLAISDSLPEDTYTIIWQTAAPDGHKVNGSFAFTYSTAEPEGDSGR